MNFRESTKYVRVFMRPFMYIYIYIYSCIDVYAYYISPIQPDLIIHFLKYNISEAYALFIYILTDFSRPLYVP